MKTLYQEYATKGSHLGTSICKTPNCSLVGVVITGGASVGMGKATLSTVAAAGSVSTVGGIAAAAGAGGLGTAQELSGVFHDI